MDQSAILAKATALPPLSSAEPPSAPRSSPSPPSVAGLLRKLGLPWAVALAVSAVLVAAGRHWPDPLLAQPWAQARPELPLQLALALVLLPPAAMAAVLLRRLVAAPGRGESSDCAQGER